MAKQQVKSGFADILSAFENGLEKKISDKIPAWEGLEVPTSLAFEQCSSQKTAEYKLRFIPEGAMVADLTGGLGVDSACFCSKAAHLHYFEQDKTLFEAATRNFSKLGLDAVITAHNETVGTDTAIPDCDIIYMDPARRNAAGRKVFKLEDCSPDVTTLMPKLWQHTGAILLKLSPMADISMLCSQLGYVKEIHVVETYGEVKELLFYMEKGYEGEPVIHATDTIRSFTFRRSEELGTEALIAAPRCCQYVYLPSGALMKAGAFNSIGLPRLSPHSHLYLSCCPNASLPGRMYQIESILPFNSSTIKALRGRWTHADVSAHDLPIKSAELAARLSCKSGGEYHIFASPSPEGNLLLICRK